MILTLPLPRNMANWRAHWRVKHNEQKAYAAKCNYMVIDKQIPRAPKVPYDRFAVHCTLYLCGKPMDQDNAGARMKWVNDWLVRSGYLAGDDPSHMVQFSVSQVRVKHRNEARVEVAITNMHTAEAA